MPLILFSTSFEISDRSLLHNLFIQLCTIAINDVLGTYQFVYLHVKLTQSKIFANFFPLEIPRPVDETVENVWIRNNLIQNRHSGIHLTIYAVKIDENDSNILTYVRKFELYLQQHLFHAATNTSLFELSCLRINKVLFSIDCCRVHLR